MNYYEKHIGDYIRDTVSLTMTEDGAYNRMIDQVYQSEKPLPADKKLIYRLARATSPADRKAVDFVLETFFQATPEGYTQKRVQQEIERYQEKQRKAKASADARWSRAKPDANASQTHHASDMRTHSEGNAHQTPDTRHQTTDKNHTPPAPDGSPTPSAVGALCIAMRASGVMAQPADPRVMALADQGVQPETVTAACDEAKRCKPGERIPPGLVIAILERWAREAASVKATGAAQPRASPRQAGQANTQRLIDRINRKETHEPDDRIIDINDRPA